MAFLSFSFSTDGVKGGVETKKHPTISRKSRKKKLDIYRDSLISDQSQISALTPDPRKKKRKEKWRKKVRSDTQKFGCAIFR